MAKRVRKFVDRAFARTIDLNLLRRLLDPYAGRIRLECFDPQRSEPEQREAIFELFRNADGTFPASLQFALFNISTLSTDTGARFLQLHADERGVNLVPAEEFEGPRDARHLNPRHLALVAWLDHRPIFDRALDAVAFLSHSSKLELSGRHEGIIARQNEPAACETFERAVADYFTSRYQGRYSDIRWYSEDDRVRALVLHGSRANTKNVEADGGERSLSFREIVQDTIEYDAVRGTISVGAKTAPDARMLANLFGEHLLGDAEFFKGSEAGNFYTLEPINRDGAAFRFNFDWDDDVLSVCVREVQVDEGEHLVGGRKRYSPWAMTVRDRENALRRLADLSPDVDFADLRINYVKIEFQLKIEGSQTIVMLKLKPPGVASFRDHSHESIILEHLERNGLRRPPPTLQAAAAAE